MKKSRWQFVQLVVLALVLCAGAYCSADTLPRGVEKEWVLDDTEKAAIEYMNLQAAQITREQEALNARREALSARWSAITNQIRKRLGVEVGSEVNYDPQRQTFQLMAPIASATNVVAPVKTQ